MVLAHCLFVLQLPVEFEFLRFDSCHDEIFCYAAFRPSFARWLRNDFDFLQNRSFLGKYCNIESTVCYNSSEVFIAS